MTASDEFRRSRIPLADGQGAIPAVGFGTLIPDPVATKAATKVALEVGFRHLDCAERYRNEEEVGVAIREAIAAGTVRREELFVTTKLWNTNHRPERVRPAFEASLRRLQIDYADCYLIHTPFAFRPGDDQDPRDENGQPIYDDGVTLAETWGALEHLVDDGHCRSIGLSDVTLEKVQEIVEIARIKPAVVQVESHPYLPEWELLSFCQEHGIVLLAFAALGHSSTPNLLEDPVLTAIAARLNMAARSGRPVLGRAARHRLLDHLDQTAADPGELRDFAPPGRRHVRHSQPDHPERQVQHGGAHRRARFHSARRVT